MSSLDRNLQTGRKSLAQTSGNIVKMSVQGSVPAAIVEVSKLAAHSDQAMKARGMRSCTGVHNVFGFLVACRHGVARRDQLIMNVVILLTQI
jgi:hypothetical protein